MIDFYIVGLKFAEETYAYNERIELCCEIIPSIVDKAIAQLGKDYIILVLLWEYSLTKNGAITYEEKREGLAKLEECIKNFPNVILIPGSFSSCGPLEPDKEKKIRENYDAIQGNPLYNGYYDVEKQMTILTEQGLAEKKYPVYENASYIMTGSYRKKHKKSTPILERTMGQISTTKALFNIGFNIYDEKKDVYFSPTYPIKIADKNMQIAILVGQQIPTKI